PIYGDRHPPTAVDCEPHQPVTIPPAIAAMHPSPRRLRLRLRLPAMPLVLQPVTFREACAFVARHHGHHKPPRGWKFGVGVAGGDQLVGVAMVGRPVSRHLDDGRTLEVLRCCTDGSAPNAASKLYAACWRAARALGYERLVSYTVAQEAGTSL